MHTHSRHSCDSAAGMLEMAAAAAKKGLAGIAFTDHVEWYEGDDALDYLNTDDYFSELEDARAAMKDGPSLLAGLEIGSPHLFPAETEKIVSACPWDYILGSVHWHGNKPGWSPLSYQDGYESACRTYYEELAIMAEKGDFDVAAHFDLVRRDIFHMFKTIPDFTDFEEIIRHTLSVLVKRGKGLEINTSGIRYGLDGFLPDPLILQWYREAGGEILVAGSDAHSPSYIGQYLHEAKEFAAKAGFTRFACYKKRMISHWIPL